VRSFFEGRLIVETGDITRARVDAIVNAANSSLLGGGGVDGAIHRAGGPAILAECRKLRAERFPDGLPPGKAVQTTGGALPCRYVIHTVGPIWHGGGHGEAGLLAGCYGESLALAAGLGLSSIALPAISTGVYGYPRHLAAAVAWKAVTEYMSAQPLPSCIRLVFFSADDALVFLESVGKA
jgi:O-acetyl-ADP-ribose deacetylase (regulator of RNase III)